MKLTRCISREKALEEIIQLCGKHKKRVNTVETRRGYVLIDIMSYMKKPDLDEFPEPLKNKLKNTEIEYNFRSDASNYSLDPLWGRLSDNEITQFFKTLLGFCTWMTLTFGEEDELYYRES